MSETNPSRRLPLWLFWSLITIVMWGTWGLVSKIASGGVDAYMNQLLFTAGIAPLLIFVSWKVGRGASGEKREGRGRGVFWAFLTGILGGVGNMAVDLNGLDPPPFALGQQLLLRPLCAHGCREPLPIRRPKKRRGVHGVAVGARRARQD